MAAQGRFRSVISVAVKFTLLVPVCLVVWWIIMPGYLLAMGTCTQWLLHYGFGKPVESCSISGTGLTNPDGLMNTGTKLTFLVEGTPRTMPEVASLVTNIAPYIALVLATPRLKWKRRLGITLLGCGILALGHIGFLLIAFLAGQTEVSMAIAQLFITLPFLLWIVLAYWQQLSAYIVATVTPETQHKT